MTTHNKMTARCQTFGDWGAPAACWDAWGGGGDRWAEHLTRCRECRAAVEAERKRNRLRPDDSDTPRRAGLDP